MYCYGTVMDTRTCAMVNNMVIVWFNFAMVGLSLVLAMVLLSPVIIMVSYGLFAMVTIWPIIVMVIVWF